MRVIRIHILFLLVWLFLGHSFLDAKDAEKDIDQQTNKKNLKSEKNQNNNDNKRGKKQKNKKPPVVLPPPTVYHHKPISRTRRWLKRIRMGPARLLQRNTTNQTSHFLEDAFYDPKKGFEMAVLSGLAYWEFHKKDPPNNATGFSLLSQNHSNYIGYRRRLRNVIRQSPPIATIMERYRNETKIDRANRINSETTNSQKNPYYQLDYYFYNWHEPTGVKGVSFHDTDVLIATMDGKELVVAFAGTASVADAVTNVQTFEPANHSKFFEPAESDPANTYWRSWQQALKKAAGVSMIPGEAIPAEASTGTKTQGSLHRGFLNAYSRVDRGHVMRMKHPESVQRKKQQQQQSQTERNVKPKLKKPRPPILDSLDRRFGHCYIDYNPQANSNVEEKEDEFDGMIENDGNQTETNTDSKKKKPKKKKQKKKKDGGCKSTETIRLSVVLKELVNQALNNGYTVHITGHSLGGALATLMALDVLTNTNDSGKNTNTNREFETNLHLWTFGAPQIADSLFWESMLNHSPKLRRHLQGGRRHRQWFHRYVTLSDNGKVDAISEVAKNTLAAHKEAETNAPTDNTESNEKKETSKKSSTELATTNVVTTSDEDNSSTDENSDERKMKKKIKPKPQMTKRGLGVWHGRAAQSLGGVSRGGEVTHFVEAHYLWTPDQQQQQQQHRVQEKVQVVKKKKPPQNNPQTCNDGDAEGDCKQQQQNEEESTSDEATAAAAAAAEAVTDTRSSVTAHSIRNYLMGISREAGPDQHPLIPDVPSEWLEYLEIASR